MRTVHKIEAHERRLRSEDLRIDLFQHLTPEIVITVAGGAGKAGLRHAVVLKGFHHPAGVGHGNFLHGGERRGNARFGTPSHGTDLRAQFR